MSYQLIGRQGQPYSSDQPGLLGGNCSERIYGRLDCLSTARAIAVGGYVGGRVFFADEITTINAGYRPCVRCLPERHSAWK